MHLLSKSINKQIKSSSYCIIDVQLLAIILLQTSKSLSECKTRNIFTSGLRLTL